MKVGTLVGILLVLVGIAGFIYEAVHRTERDTASLGPVHVTVQHTNPVPVVPLVASGIAIVAGVALIVAVRRAS